MNQQLKKSPMSDSTADAIAFAGIILIAVTTVVYWLSLQ